MNREPSRGLRPAILLPPALATPEAAATPRVSARAAVSQPKPNEAFVDLHDFVFDVARVWRR
jgi:hypothetical protein